jgi:hypothetical protein
MFPEVASSVEVTTMLQLGGFSESLGRFDAVCALWSEAARTASLSGGTKAALMAPLTEQGPEQGSEDLPAAPLFPDRLSCTFALRAWGSFGHTGPGRKDRSGQVWGAQKIAAQYLWKGDEFSGHFVLMLEMTVFK